MNWTVVETPVGPLSLLATEAGLRGLQFRGEPPPADAVRAPNAVLAAAEQELHEYFDGARQEFTLPLDLVGTPFQRRAWLALASIPFGTTTSYGEQARRLGHARAIRAIGAANGRNPVPIVLPCHRVIGAAGGLVGYGGGLDVKRALLAHEARVIARLR